MSEEETNQMIQKIISDSSKESDDWSRCSLRTLYSLYIYESHESDFSQTHACLNVYHFSSLRIGPTRKTSKKRSDDTPFGTLYIRGPHCLCIINDRKRNSYILMFVWRFSCMNVSCVCICIQINGCWWSSSFFIQNFYRNRGFHMLTSLFCSVLTSKSSRPSSTRLTSHNHLSFFI